MAPVEVEVTISSAKDLKNVNWRHGDLRPYAVVWVDPSAKSSTRVDDRNDTDPVWNEKLTIPLRDRRVEDSTLSIDIVHANAEEGTKPLIGSARLPLADVLDEVGLGQKCFRKLKLKRLSGRPHGKLEVEVEIREPRYYAPPPAAYAPPYGQGHQSSSRDLPYAYGAPPPYAASAPPPAGYPYNPSPRNKIEGFLFTKTKKQKTKTKLIRFPRFTLLVAVEFNQSGYSSLNFRRWKRIAAMQG